MNHIKLDKPHDISIVFRYNRNLGKAIPNSFNNFIEKNTEIIYTIDQISFSENFIIIYLHNNIDEVEFKEIIYNWEYVNFEINPIR